MDEVKCLRCNTVDEFYIEHSGPHIKAICNNCNRYIKFVPQLLEPKLHFGKYKNTDISKIEDMDYLKWVLANVKLSSKIKNAIETRISTFEHLAK